MGALLRKIVCMAAAFLLLLLALPVLGEASLPLPVIRIETENGAEVLSREEYVNCTVTVEEGEGPVGGAAQIRVRGNTSAYNGDVEQIRLNQVPYKLKFTEKTPLLSLNGGQAFKSWVLLVADYNLVHTPVIFSLGWAMGSFFTPDAKLCELYLNGEYAGLYYACDQKQVKKYRVDISQPEEGYTGTDIGYWVEIDHYAEKGSSFVMKYDGRAELTDLNGETRAPVKAKYSLQSDFYSEDQLNFIGNYVNGVYSILRRACQLGEYYTLNSKGKLVKTEASSPKEAIESCFNLEAAVDMYILQEMSRNGDVGKGSFFMYADFGPEAEDHRLTFTTPWDFTMVVDQAVEGFQAGCFFNEKFVMDNGDNSNPWFVLLLGQDWFREMVKDRLKELREGGVLDRVFEEQRSDIEAHRAALLKHDSSGWQLDGPDGAFEELKWMRERLTWLENVL